MRSDLVCLIALLLWVFVAGCTVFDKAVSPARKISEQERSFAGALQFLRAGNEQQARELLEKVSEAPAVSGITDEAIFRLALLKLGDYGGREAVQSQILLDRLSNEFPESIWTYQSAPLVSYLAGIKTVRDRQRELKTLQNLNLSLSRDNRELRQILERLKQLDLELEQKIKR